MMKTKEQIEIEFSTYLKGRSYAISEAILEITTPLQFIGLMFDVLFTLVPVVVLPTFVLAGFSFIALCGIYSVVTYMGTYKELKEIERKAEKESKQLLSQTDIDFVINPDLILKPAKHPPSRWQHVKKAFDAMLLMTSTLLYLYYAVTLGLSALFVDSALAALLIGPIGLGLAIGVTTVVGACFGYMQYQQSKEQCRIERAQKRLEKLAGEDVIAERERPIEKTPQAQANERDSIKVEPHHRYKQRHFMRLPRRFVWASFFHYPKRGTDYRNGYVGSKRTNHLHRPRELQPVGP